MPGVPLGIAPAAFRDACAPAVAAMQTQGGLGDEFSYASVPLCIVDAVFSLGVNYAQVQNVVGRFCAWSGWPRFRSRSDSLPTTREQSGMLVSDFAALASSQTNFVDEVFDNRGRVFQRKYAPYKAEVVFRFAAVLADAGVETFESLQDAATDLSLDAALRALPGQSAGTAVSYFFMLAGRDDLVKPDRMLLRFTNRYLGKSGKHLNDALPIQGIQVLYRDTAALLGVTARELDYSVWGRESGRF